MKEQHWKEKNYGGSGYCRTAIIIYEYYREHIHKVEQLTIESKVNSDQTVSLKLVIFIKEATKLLKECDNIF